MTPAPAPTPWLLRWQGLLAPGGTPDTIIDKINGPITTYLQTPAAAERLKQIGVDVKSTTPPEMRDWIETQLRYWENTAKSAGIVPQ